MPNHTDTAHALAEIIGTMDASALDALIIAASRARNATVYLHRVQDSRASSEDRMIARQDACQTRLRLAATLAPLMRSAIRNAPEFATEEV
jgi:hypothetical protein